LRLFLFSDYDIQLLVPVNVNSNPGNVPLAFAMVLVSELLGIPVLNSNHDFYWEGGNREVEIQEKGLERGPRDFFYHNSQTVYARGAQCSQTLSC